MTQFVWDASSYDGKISAAAMAQAKREGIVAFTHRLTRQGGALDPYAGYNLAQARDAGIELLGAYAVTYTSGGSQQDDLTVRYADQVVSWWRTWHGWFWQVDLEKWPTDPVPASVGVQEARELRAGTGRQVVLYGSKGQYGDSLAAWDGPLWNARYPSSAQAPFRDLYPGDSGSGWQTYSGQMPALWQYASSATIGGLTTCDVSAYRGTLDQLRALLTGSATATSTGADMELNTPIPGSGYGSKPQTLDVGLALVDLTKALDPYDTSAWQNEQLRNSRAILAAVQKLTAPPAVDVDALAEKVAAALVASNANGLTAADHAAVVEDVKTALRSGTAQ